MLWLILLLTELQMSDYSLRWSKYDPSHDDFTKVYIYFKHFNSDNKLGFDSGVNVGKNRWVVKLDTKSMCTKLYIIPLFTGHS